MTAPGTGPQAHSDDRGRGEWHRVHPATVLFELAKALQQVIVAFLVVAGGDLFNSAVEAAIIAVPLGAAVARWYTTRYAVDAEAIRLEYGLIWRRKQVMPRARVQNVTSRSNLFARALGLVELQISEASSGGDIDIRYIDRVSGERLATVLRSDRAPIPTPTSASTTASTTASTPASTTALHPAPDLASAPAPTLDAAPDADLGPAFHAPPFTEVLKVQLARNSISWIVGTAVVLAFVVGPIVAHRIDPELDVGGPATSTIGTIFVLGMIVFANANTILSLGDFHLWDEPDRLRIRCGLLTEHRQSIRRDRIQALRVDHHVFLRWIGREQVAFETADLDLGQGPTTTVLSPAAPRGAWSELGRVVFGPIELGEDDLQPVSRRTILRVGIKWTVLAFVEAAVVGAVLVAFGATVWWPVAVGLLVAGSILGWIHAFWRWRRLGWAIDDRHLLVRLGIVAVRLHLIDLDKVQIVRTGSTFFQRRRSLTSVALSTAGRGTAGSVTIPDLSAPVADALAARLIAHSIATPFERTI